MEIEKCLGNSTIFEGIGVRVLESISCTKCIICIILLVIKWAKLWSEGFYELWMIDMFDWYENLKECFLWDMSVG